MGGDSNAGRHKGKYGPDGYVFCCLFVVGGVGRDVNNTVGDSNAGRDRGTGRQEEDVEGRDKEEGGQTRGAGVNRGLRRAGGRRSGAEDLAVGGGGEQRGRANRSGWRLDNIAVVLSPPCLGLGFEICHVR